MELRVFGEDWAVILLMTVAAFSMGMTLLLLNWVVAPAKPSPVKRSPKRPMR